MKEHVRKISLGMIGFLVIGVLFGCDLATPAPNGPVEPQVYTPQEWIQVGDYTIKIHEVSQEVIPDGDGGMQRVVYLDVEYDNQGREPLSYRLNQWSVFDTENYVYDYEIMDRYYVDQGKPRLRESMLNPGMQVKGWAAFLVPDDVIIDRAQFLTGFLDSDAADIVIEPSGKP